MHSPLSIIALLAAMGALCFQWGLELAKPAFALEEAIRRGHKRILVLAPKNAALRVWQKEIQKHTGYAFDVCVPRKGSVQDRAWEADAAMFADYGEKPFVLVLNYEAAWRPPVRRNCQGRTTELSHAQCHGPRLALGASLRSRDLR